MRLKYGEADYDAFFFVMTTNTFPYTGLDANILAECARTTLENMNRPGGTWSAESKAPYERVVADPAGMLYEMERCELIKQQ